MIHVFVGCAANHEDAESQAVLEYTLRLHASEPVDITWMKLSKDPESPFYSDAGDGWNTTKWATPFSGFRWAVPWLCKFKGRAIYMDSDFIVMADIAELWHQKFRPGKAVLAKGSLASWRMCLSMWDCAEARHCMLPMSKLIVDAGAHKAMTQRFLDNSQVVQDFAGQWNCLDGEGYASINDPEIKAIHYTSMRHQPHLERACARLRNDGRAHWFDGTPERHWREDLIDLFDSMLYGAELSGYLVENYCRDPLFGPYIKASVANVRRPALASNFRQSAR